MSRPTPIELEVRRHALLEALDGAPAIIAAGLPAPRNYAGNAYPYRASSHFLYFAGHALPGAYVSFDDQGATVFAPTPPDDDALWHGHTPTASELEALIGCPVRSLSELPSGLQQAAATLPPVDAESRASLGALLHRPLNEAAMTAGDAALADAVIELRLRHDDAAQRDLVNAAGATAAAHLAGMNATRVGDREYVVRAAMEHALVSRGMTTAYPPIVTVHGEVLHNHDYHHELQDGDLLLADVGAETPGGMAGDVTRTWPVGGTFNGPQRDIYDAVLRSQERAIQLCRPGTRYRDVHLEASLSLAEDLVSLGILRGDPAELVADGVHALFFPHGVGHLLGLDVHDMEDLGDRAGYAAGRERSDQFGLSYLRLDRDLQAGMAVTIEPGFYLVPAILEDPERRAKAADRVNWERVAAFSTVRGIRIEDDILVTKGEPRVLTDAIPKTASAIEATLGERP